VSTLHRQDPRSLSARAPARWLAALCLGVLLAAGGCADGPSEDARVRAAVTALEARAPVMVRLPAAPAMLPAGCDGLLAAGDLVLGLDATPGVFAVYRGTRPVCQDEAGLLAEATLGLADALGFDADRDLALPLDLLERGGDPTVIPREDATGGQDRVAPWLLRSAPGPDTATTDDATADRRSGNDGTEKDRAASSGGDDTAGDPPTGGDPFPQPSDGGGGGANAGDPFPQPSDGGGGAHAGDPFPQPSDGGGGPTAGDPFPQPSDGGGGATAGDPFPQPSDGGGGGADAGDPFPQPSDGGGNVGQEGTAGRHASSRSDGQSAQDGNLGTRQEPCPDAEMAAMAEATHWSP